MREQDEFPESRSATIYAKSKSAAISDRLLHFPRSELVEARVLSPARRGHLGKYHIYVSEDLD